MRRFALLIAAGVLLGAGTAHSDPLDDLAAHLAKGATKLKSRQVAVLAFTYPDGGISTGSSLVAEGLTTKLVGRKKISVIERSQLSKILSEQKLELSGISGAAGSQKLGQILGVDAIVTGTLVDLSNNKTAVNARLIASASGEVLSAAATEINRTWEDAPRQPPSTDTNDEDHQTRYMSPLIPVQQGPYGLGSAQTIRRRPVVVNDYNN